MPHNHSRLSIAVLTGQMLHICTVVNEIQLLLTVTIISVEQAKHKHGTIAMYGKRYFN